MSPVLSLVIPVFNEESVLPELDRRLRAFLKDLPGVGEAWEVIFVNDGSRDSSAKLLAQLATEPRYRVVNLARNFGHQMAITAGIDRANGEAVVVMDADLQDPPEVVAAMLARWREGFDGTAWRLRPFVRFSLPFRDGHRTALVLSHESFIDLNTTNFQRVEGEERMRNQIAISTPLVKAITAEIGYLNQHSFVPRGRDNDDHAATLTLSFSL